MSCNQLLACYGDGSIRVWNLDLNSCIRQPSRIVIGRTVSEDPSTQSPLVPRLRFVIRPEDHYVSKTGESAPHDLIASGLLDSSSACFHPSFCTNGLQPVLSAALMDGTLVWWRYSSTRPIGGPNDAWLKNNLPVSGDKDRLSTDSRAHLLRFSSLKKSKQNGTKTSHLATRVFFRKHTSRVAKFGFVGNLGSESPTMISIDTTGLVCLWRFEEQYISAFGHVAPFKCFQLDLFISKVIKGWSAFHRDASHRVIRRSSSVSNMQRSNSTFSIASGTSSIVPFDGNAQGAGERRSRLLFSLNFEMTQFGMRAPQLPSIQRRVSQGFEDVLPSYIGQSTLVRVERNSDSRGSFTLWYATENQSNHDLDRVPPASAATRLSSSVPSKSMTSPVSLHSVQFDSNSGLLTEVKEVPGQVESVLGTIVQAELSVARTDLIVMMQYTCGMTSAQRSTASSAWQPDGNGKRPEEARLYRLVVLSLANMTSARNTEHEDDTVISRETDHGVEDQEQKSSRPSISPISVIDFEVSRGHNVYFCASPLVSQVCSDYIYVLTSQVGNCACKLRVFSLTTCNQVAFHSIQLQNPPQPNCGSVRFSISADHTHLLVDTSGGSGGVEYFRLKPSEEWMHSAGRHLPTFTLTRTACRIGAAPGEVTEGGLDRYPMEKRSTQESPCFYIGTVRLPSYTGPPEKSVEGEDGTLEGVKSVRNRDADDTRTSSSPLSNLSDNVERLATIQEVDEDMFPLSSQGTTEDERSPSRAEALLESSMVLESSPTGNISPLASPQPSVLNVNDLDYVRISEKDRDQTDRKGKGEGLEHSTEQQARERKKTVGQAPKDQAPTEFFVPRRHCFHQNIIRELVVNMSHLAVEQVSAEERATLAAEEGEGTETADTGLSLQFDLVG